MGPYAAIFRYPHSPETAHDLWTLIDRLNADRPDLYGGGIWDHPQLGRIITLLAGGVGQRLLQRRLAEQVAREVKSLARPLTVSARQGWVQALLQACAL